MVNCFTPIYYVCQRNPDLENRSGLMEREGDEAEGFYGDLKHSRIGADPTADLVR